MSHRVYLMKISAGIYFYSYVVIPAQINHNTVYTITNDYIYVTDVAMPVRAVCKTSLSWPQKEAL